MHAEPIFLIQLCSSRYRVRVIHNAREVFVGSEWLTVEKFVDFLFDTRKYDELAEAAKSGLGLISGESSK